MGRDEVASEIADAIERLGRFIRSRGYACDLNPAQWEALRYLGRCNRFSNNPSALANFLNATKGTVSQTLSSLERKGLLSKVPRPGHGRSLSLMLTDQGRALLDRDPQQALEAVAGELGPDVDVLAGHLGHLLAEYQMHFGFRSFGKCRTCRYFDDRISDGNTCRCELLGAQIEKSETTQICAEHTPRGASGVS
jgi:DNA-binding MarR family transcriptional regulator